MPCYLCQHIPFVLQSRLKSGTFYNSTVYQGCNCVVCDTFCETIEALNLHEKEKHSSFAYKCGDCNKIFNSQSTFKEHEKYHSGYKQCPACDKKFLNDDRYDFHANTRKYFEESDILIDFRRCLFNHFLETFS